MQIFIYEKIHRASHIFQLSADMSFTCLNSSSSTLPHTQ